MLGDERQSRGRDRAPSPHPKTTAPDFALSPSRYRASLLRRLSRGRATLRLPKAEGIQAEKRVELAKAEPPPPPPPPPSPGREEGRVLSPEGYEADDEAARVQITWMCDELSHLSGLTFRLHDSPPHNLWATGPRHWRTCPFGKRSHAYWTCRQAHWERSNYMTPYTSTRDFWRLRFKHQPSPGSMASRKKKPDRDMLRRKM